MEQIPRQFNNEKGIPVLFSQIDRLAQLSRQKGLSGDEGFRSKVFIFNKQLTGQYTIEELRQVPEYHKLIGSTQQEAYEASDSRR